VFCQSYQIVAIAVDCLFQDGFRVCGFVSGTRVLGLGPHDF